MGEQMNFQGRYYTKNGTLVGVHPTAKNDSITFTPEASWWGHKIVLKAKELGPNGFVDERVFYWDEKGNCVSYTPMKSGVNLDTFNLKTRISGKDCKEARIEVMDCESCKEEKNK
jgi:hypothetical protein